MGKSPLEHEEKGTRTDSSVWSQSLVQEFKVLATTSAQRVLKCAILDCIRSREDLHGSLKTGLMNKSASSRSDHKRYLGLFTSWTTK